MADYARHRAPGRLRYLLGQSFGSNSKRRERSGPGRLALFDGLFRDCQSAFVKRNSPGDAGNPFTQITSVAGSFSTPIPAPSPWTSSGWADQPNLQNPYLQQWNVDIQRQFGANEMLSVAYVGSVDHDLPYTGSAKSQPWRRWPRRTERPRPLLTRCAPCLGWLRAPFSTLRLWASLIQCARGQLPAAVNQRIEYLGLLYVEQIAR